MIDLDDWSEENVSINLEIRQDCKNIIEFFLDYQGSIRQCASWVRLSRYKVHRYIHTYIRYYWDEEYVRIVNMLRYNKKNRFKPRAKWERGNHRG